MDRSKKILIATGNVYCVSSCATPERDFNFARSIGLKRIDGHLQHPFCAEVILAGARPLETRRLLSNQTDDTPLVKLNDDGTTKSYGSAWCHSTTMKSPGFGACAARSSRCFRSAATWSPGRAQLRALEEGHLSACSIRRNFLGAAWRLRKAPKSSQNPEI